MRHLLSTSIVFVAGVALSGAAAAQPDYQGGSQPGYQNAPQQGYEGAAQQGYQRGAVISSPPSPDTARESAGIPGPAAVNPAPGRTGPYVGVGARRFYDVDARIAAISDRARSLPHTEQRQAMAQLHQIRANEATQRARHGDLRDWDREHLNVKLDHLVQQFPALGAGEEQGPAPAQ